MPELLITSSLEPVEQGDVFERELPLHVTVWQYFDIKRSLVDDFANEVGDIVGGFSPLELIATKLERHGEYSDTPTRSVIALGGAATLITLHSVLGASIHAHGGKIRSPESAYERYNPHIAIMNDADVEEGEYIKLSYVELVEKHRSGAKIIRNVWELEDI